MGKPKFFQRNPVYEKELWTVNRSPLFALAVIGYHAVMCILALVVFSSMQGTIQSRGQESYSMMLQMYILLGMIECMLVVVITPGLAGGGIARERECHALEVMQVSGLGAGRIVAGKLKACMNTLFILILSGFPALSMVFVYGGIQVEDCIQAAIVLVIVACYLCSLSLLCSAAARKSGHAIVIAYGVTLTLLAATLLIHYMPLLLLGQSYGEHPGSPIAWYHYLLLFNPLVTFFSVMNRQAGSRDFIFDLINYQGNYRPNWATEHWIGISLAVQIAASVLFLAAAARIVAKRK